jgi:biotin carboxyl carrier protein
MQAERSPFGFRLVVSPATGRLRLLPPRRFERGVEVVEAGQALAHIELNGRHTVVRAPVRGRVSAVLGLEGEPVTLGTPVLTIEPETE